MEIDGQTYMPRIIDKAVDLNLKAFGAVEITGAMWSGKTWTARAHGNSLVSFDSDVVRELAAIDMNLALQGDAPLVIDEWQAMPAVWDAVRHKVDEAAGQRGLYILTGSSRPAKSQTRHTGSGRIAQLAMWPMSLYESGHSSGSVSLSALFEGEFNGSPVSTDLRQIASRICLGGWPGAITLDEEEAELIPYQYVNALLNKEDAVAPGSRQEMRLFLQSLARNIGSAVTLETLACDMGLNADEKRKQTQTKLVKTYIEYFLDRYVVCDLHGWDAPIKSPRRLRTKAKHGFADPSLAAALLGVGPDALLKNTQVFGQLFEELCLRDLRVYTSALQKSHPDSLRYYRDSDGLEVDAIIELQDGRWAAIEIKLGANKVKEAERSLLRLRDKVAANQAARNPEPSFMLVLVAKTDYMYQLPSGVIVAPITELGV